MSLQPSESEPLDEAPKGSAVSKSDEDIKMMDGKQKNQKRKKLKPKYIYVNVTQAYYPLIQEALENYGFKITESETKANLFWINHNGSLDTASELYPWQFYNHFPGIVSISRKVELAKNIEAVAHIMPEAFSFNPESFIVPLQYNDLKNYMLSIKNPRQRTFIIKPDKGSLGKGIILVQDPTQLETYTQNSIAQKYIDPYLIDGLKFDLRIYVLVTSIEPLRMYVHDEGMARFCTEPYQDPSPRNLEQVFSHLTNYSLNKKNEHFQANEIIEEEETGHKRSMTSIFESIKKNGHDVVKLKHQIDEILRLTLASVQHYVASQYRIGCTSKDGKSRCFEILGFDILIDKDCKPWLLEVNNKPSMASDSEFDRQLKTAVIQGAMHIINLQPNFKKSVNQRIIELSLSKGQPQSQKFSDPDGESLRAKDTQWRQLYPLLEGEVSDIEKGLLAARQANGFKPRKEQQTQQPTNAPPPSFSQPTQPPLRKISAPAQRIVRPYQKSEKNVQPIQSRIINKPTRASSQPKNDDSPLVIQLKDLEPNCIIEEEERERLRNVRKRASAAVSVSYLQRLKAMLSVVGTIPKKNEMALGYGNQIAAQPLSIYPKHPNERPNMKPMIAKQFNIPDLVS